MSTLYTSNFRLEHFSGWSTSAPDYASVTSSDTAEQNKLGYIVPASDQQDSNPYVLGCLRSNIVDGIGTSVDLSNLWIAWQDVSLNAGSNTELIQLIVHGKDKNGNEAFVFLTKQSTSTTNTVVNVYMNTELAFNTPIMTFNITDTNSKLIRLSYINIQGAGTDSGSITVYTQPAADYTKLSTLGTWSGDMTDYVSFNSVTYHRTMTGTGSNNYLYYLLVSDFRLLKMIFSYSVASAIGTFSDWSGTMTSFSTYPVDFLTYGTGLSATSINKKETFTFPSITQTQGFTPVAVVYSAAVKAGLEIADPIIEDVVTDGSNIYTSETKDVSQTGSALMWSYTLNPLIGAKWTVTSVNSTQLGVNRVS